jgi:protein CpxP
MKRQIIIPTLMIGALLAGGVTLATAKPWGSGYGNCGGQSQRMTAEQHEERMEHRLEMMSEILGLSENQEEQIEALFKANYEQNYARREQMRASRDELREKMHAENFNEAEFRTLAEQQAQLKTDLMVERAKIKQQVFAILTPEQQEKADKLMELRGHGKHGRHGGRHGGQGYGF